MFSKARMKVMIMTAQRTKLSIRSIIGTEDKLNLVSDYPVD